jgi:hypothetical protein
MHAYAWKTFYADCSQEIRMARLFLDVIRKEQADGTFRRVRPAGGRAWRREAAP